VISESARKSDHVRKAEDILRGEAASLSTMFDLAQQLKLEKAFSHARRILGLARKDPELRHNPSLVRTLAQQHALCTSKDANLPSREKFDRALEILQEGEDLPTTTDQETLGIAGGIYKRKWEFDGQKIHLERALVYYLRGYKVGVASDYGYTGINAAYILDMLADLEPPEVVALSDGADSITLRRDQARRIREDIVQTLSELVRQTQREGLKGQWWFTVTMAEAHFGLGQYEAAGDWLTKARQIKDVAEWEYETTARQLASIARLQAEDTGSSDDFVGSRAWETLSAFLEDNLAGVRTAFLGKVGLALSGGGFRASLYHIGVLARLAELDWLRHIEVLSCVSGGSIIGAHYYLEVRKLLQEKADQEIKREDYLEIVKRIEKDFLDGVETNIRMQSTARLWTNLKIILIPNYSRTLRVGELFETEIFSRVRDGGQDKPRWLNQLFIQPLNEPASFAPKNQNWRRRAKVPVLILNAATLNTGHNWQFTASWMGEPPSSIETEVDGNYRLRRMYYGEAPHGHRHIRLGHAVAASASVPGLFEPLALTNLYPRITVRLVDGGTHDNQGVASLIEQDCTVMLVSDASGQMQTKDDASNNFAGVLLRSNGILQARVREAQFHELDARRRSALLRRLIFVHLKKDLDEEPIDWINCPEPLEASDEARPRALRGPLTRYGILKRIQRLLAAVRTDLDSFSEAEAYALMTSGYRAIECEFKRFTGRAAPTTDDPPPWRFLKIEEPMKREEGCEQAHHRLTRLLDRARGRAFKIWWLDPLEPTLLLLSILALTAFLALTGFYLYGRLSQLRGLGIVLWYVGVLIAATIIFEILLRLIYFRKTLAQFFIDLLIGIIGWPLARLHLHLFDKLYLDWGRIRHFVKAQPAPPRPPSRSNQAIERPTISSQKLAG
jgi:predicted acylesterase/phospholipase RssA